MIRIFDGLSSHFHLKMHHFANTTSIFALFKGNKKQQKLIPNSQQALKCKKDRIIKVERFISAYQK